MNVVFFERGGKKGLKVAIRNDLKFSSGSLTARAALFEAFVLIAIELSLAYTGQALLVNTFVCSSFEPVYATSNRCKTICDVFMNVNNSW